MENDKKKDMTTVVRIPEGPYDIIKTSSSGVSVTASGIDDTDHEYHYPAELSSGEIVAATSTDLGIEFESQEKVKFVEKVDNVKTYLSEMDLKLSFTGINFKIKWEPKTKIIKKYKEKTLLK